MKRCNITLTAWQKKYQRIIASREIDDSTRLEKRRYAKALVKIIGGRKQLKKVRPLHIARAIRALWNSGRQIAARRMLVVARDLFGEAVINGYLPQNPARHVKPLSCRVRRARLSFTAWQKIQAALECEKQPWRRQLALLALVSGQRRSDLVRMRFADVWNGHLHIEQAKTGARIALPLKLRLNAINMSLAEVIARCRAYAPFGDTLLRKSTGGALSASSLTLAFTRARAGLFFSWEKDRDAPSLQETRSLSERLYSAQGIDTRTLLGHRRQATTDLYHDDRGLARAEGQWRTLEI
ncbi:MAG: tyrosine-type recombinase/integrase [Zoogloeaceae bacterium]|jgi:integrase|nr:tyrosine-type recombinase/integrase [Zoogloeaceae bacterium]